MSKSIPPSLKGMSPLLSTSPHTLTWYLFNLCGSLCRTQADESYSDAIADLKPLLRGIFEKETLTGQEAQQLINSLDVARVAASILSEGKRKKKKGIEKSEMEQLMREADDLGIKLHHLADELRIKLDQSIELSNDVRNLLMAAVWHTSLRLIAFSTPLRSSFPLSTRLLGIVSQAMEALIDVEDVRAADECTLIGAEALDGIKAQLNEASPSELEQRCDAEIDFLMARSKLAVLDNNDTLALTFLQNAAGVPEVLTEEQVLTLVGRCLSIVELQSSRNRTNGDDLTLSPIPWLKQAMDILKMSADEGQSETLRPLKMIVSMQLARETLRCAGGDSKRLTEAAELLQSIEKMNMDGNNTSADFLYEIRLLKIQALKNQKSSEGPIRHAFDDLIKDLDLNEDNLNEVFAQLRAMTEEYPNLPLGIAQTFLNIASDRVVADQQNFLVRILYEGIMFARVVARAQPRSAIQAVAKMCEVALGRERATTPAENTVLLTACQTLLWNLGLSAEKKQSRLAGEAAEWYLLAGHPGFSALGADHVPRCLRKSALCHILTNNSAAALELLHKCPQKEASTHYLFFLAAMEQQNTAAALRAIEAIVTCPDVDGRHLLLITSLAEKDRCRSILVAALQALLGALKRPHSTDFIKAELVNIVKDVPIKRLIGYLRTVSDTLDADVNKHMEQVEGISWLYKSAYNTAMQGMDEGIPSGLLGDLFDQSARLMDIHTQIEPSLLDDPEFQLNRSGAMFACFCGKLFHYRELPTGEEKVELLQQLLDYLPRCQQAVPALPSNHPQAGAMGTRSGLLDVYYLELLCEAKDWKGVDGQLKDLVRRLRIRPESASVGKLERVVNLLAEYPECPMQITSCALDVLLEFCTIDIATDVVRFSRWIRSIITLLLGQNYYTNQDDDLSYFFKKSMTVLSSPLGSASYPQDELEWLLVTAWNRCLQASQKLRGGVSSRLNSMTLPLIQLDTEKQ
ncbi:hypothetical protein IAT40_007965 [Kwoniella sp. CBS 6097]